MKRWNSTFAVSATLLVALLWGFDLNAQQQGATATAATAGPSRGLAPGLKVTDLGTAARTYRVRMAKGDDILSGLTEFAEQHHIRNAHFTGLGAVDHAVFGWADSTDPSGYRRITIDEGAEIVSFTGNITVNNQGRSVVHGHGSFSLSDGSVKGGHWFEARIATIADIFVTEAEGIPAPTN